jgi:hypothetical protein
MMCVDTIKHELHGLEFIYSKERLETYNIQNVSWEMMTTTGTRRSLRELSNEQRSLHVACCDYQNANENEKYLKLRLGDLNVYPSYVSESANTVCFVALMKSVVASSLNEFSSFRSVLFFLSPLICFTLR